MYINISYGFHRIPDTQSHFITKVHDLLGQPSHMDMGMTIGLKSLNEMQQTASIRFTIIQHDITVIYITYFQMYYYLMQ